VNNSSRTGGIRFFLRGILIAPDVELPAGTSRQSRQFSGVLLALIVVGLMASISYLGETMGYHAETAVDHVVSFGTILALGVLYLLNRRGYFTITAPITVCLSALAILLSAIPSGSTNEVTMLHYLAIPIVLSGFMLSVQFTAILAAAIFAALVAFPSLFDVSEELVPYAATILISVFTLGAAIQRRQVEADRNAELRASEERYQHLATHDRLTGLPNGLLFEELVTTAIARAVRYRNRIAVLFLDLDEFKSVNDAFGHSVGDTVLQQVAARMTSLLRASDVVGHRGGDDFCILLEGIAEEEQYLRVITKVQANLSEPFDVEGRSISVTCSVGVSLGPEDSVDAQELMRRADVALYQAKALQKDSFAVYSNRMSHEAADRLVLMADLRRSIVADDIEVAYQEQIDSTTGRAVGVECLCRWTHPERGPISPGVFIPLAEESGAISDLTRLMLRKAFAELSSHGHLRRDDTFRVSVNISARDLRQGFLSDFVRRLLEEYHIAPYRLELELTENIVFQNLDQARSMLLALKDRGLRIAVDDFGSGYSTLRQIADFPIDTLKLDRSFIRSLEPGCSMEAIVAGLIEIAGRLGIEVVAEGVETKEQVDILANLGCTVIQGWYFGKAVPVDRLPTD
jgi:diguanylate cyclase (GGDEF)-like protein